MIELQVFEDGGLRLLMTRLSDTLSEEQPGHVLFDAGAVILTRRMLEIVRLTAEGAGYFGNWSLPVGATRLKGRHRYSPNILGTAPRYSADTYQEATGVTRAELTDSPGAVTRRLLGPLLRSLGSQSHYERALTDTQWHHAADTRDKRCGCTLCTTARSGRGAECPAGATADQPPMVSPVASVPHRPSNHA